jgi:peptidoglycan/LPS O-acetylase OafA/YrhL
MVSWAYSFFSFKKFLPGRSNNFDILRLLFAIFVIFSHSYALLKLPEPYGALTGGVLSHHGVSGFFFISGLLIATSWRGDPRVVVFLWKRFLRIFPGLLAAVIFSALVIGSIVTTLPISEYLRRLELLDFFKHNLSLYYVRYNLPGVFETNPYKGAVNGSLWTLPYEVLMYLIVLMLGLLGALRGPAVSVLLLLSLIGLEHFTSGSEVLARTVIWGLLPNQFIHLGIFFLIGVVSSFLIHLVPVSACLVVAIPLLVACTPCPPILWYFLFTYWVICAAYSPAIDISRLTSWGDISYGMYIYAFPIQQLLIYLFSGNVSPSRLFLYSTVLTAAISLLSWFVVERPALQLKKILVKNRG